LYQPIRTSRGSRLNEIAASLTYGLHRLLLLKKQRVLVDKETGKEVVLASGHSLFWVPVPLWPVVFVAFGLISTFVDAFKTSAQPNAAVTRNLPIQSE
jgi:hypothetical protein